MEMQKYDAARHHIIKMSFKIHLSTNFLGTSLTSIQTGEQSKNSNFVGELKI